VKKINEIMRGRTKGSTSLEICIDTCPRVVLASHPRCRQKITSRRPPVSTLIQRRRPSRISVNLVTVPFVRLAEGRTPEGRRRPSLSVSNAPLSLPKKIKVTR